MRRDQGAAGVRGGAHAREETPREFVELYEAQLGAVWRFVRSRVPDHHEAQDVTSDVFARAWRSWPRFDPAKGTAAGWPFGIVRNAVADWWRRAPREAAPRDPVDHERLAHEVADSELALSAPRSPEQALLEEDRLHAVGRALAVLTDHERETLALRFGAELKVREIAEVLGISPGAAKMTLHRAMQRLRRLAAPDREPVLAGAADADPDALVLDEVIEQVLDRGHRELSDDGLARLVLHVAAVHDPPVPDTLPGRIATCVACEGSIPDDPPDDAPSVLAATRRPDRFRAVAGGGWIALLGPACLVCVAPLWVSPPLAALVGVGLGTHPGSLPPPSLPVMIAHLVALVGFGPLIAWLVWRKRARHGLVWPSRVAVAGAVALALHALLRIDAAGTVAFTVSDWAGWGLITLAVVGDLRASLRRRREERRWLEAITADLS